MTRMLPIRWDREFCSKKQTISTRCASSKKAPPKWRNPEVQFHLGMTRYMMGEEGPAREALQKAANSDRDFPQKSEARRRLEFLSRTGSDDEAKLQDFCARHPMILWR